MLDSPNGVTSPIADFKQIQQVNLPLTEELLYILNSDGAVADLVIKMYGHRMAYVTKADEMRVFDPGAWKWDLEADWRVRNFIVDAARLLWKVISQWKIEEEIDPKRAEARKKKLLKMAESYMNYGKTEAVRKALVDKIVIRTKVEDWDANGEMILFKDGWAADMRTGEVRRPRPEDRLTAGLGIDRSMDLDRDVIDSPVMKALFEILEGLDEEMIHYFRKCLFYTLLGDKPWKAWFTVWGVANTAKTTLLKLIKKLTGDYGCTLNFSSFEDSGDAEKRFDLSGLLGKRYAMIDESAQDKAMDAKRMKWVTGGADIRVERKYRDAFDIKSEFVVWLGTNYKPRLKNDDGAVWARMRMFTLTRVFEVNPAFERQLLTHKNLQDLFIWIWGVRERYWAEGIKEMPQAMKESLEDYKKEGDWLGLWIEEELEDAAEGEESYLMDLYQALEAWMKERGFTKWRPTYLDFLGRLRERKFPTDKRRRKTGQGERKFAYLPGKKLRSGCGAYDPESWPTSLGR